MGRWLGLNLGLKLFDARAPTSNFIELTDSAQTNFTVSSAAARRIWMKGIRMFGGTGCVLTAAAGVEHQFYSYECAFNAAAATIAGGFRIASGPAIVVHQRSVSNDNWLDGFNYHGVASSTTRSECPKVVELDCSAERNGNDNGGANNASSAHEASQLIRIRTATGASDGRKYASAADRTIHDVETTHSWHLGVRIEAPRDTSAGDLVRIGGTGGTDATKMWFDAVSLGSVSGSQNHIQTEGANAVLNYANMDVGSLSITGAGTVQSYTP